MSRMQKMGSHGLSTPWNIASSTLPKSFLRRRGGRLGVLRFLVQIVFWMQRCICVLLAFRHHETLVNSNHESRILRRSQGRLWVLRTIRLLKASLKQLHQSCFFRWPGSRKWVRIAFRHLETSFHRFHQSFFKTSRRQIMCSKGNSPLETAL
jgi:hypothetical protein